MRPKLTSGIALLLFLQPAAAQQEGTEAKTKTKANTEQPGKKTVEVPFQRKPYRVLISVAFDDSPRFPNAFRRDVLQGIENAAHRTIGQIWSLDVKENRLLLPARFSTLRRLSFADVVKHPGIELFAPAEKDAAENNSPQPDVSFSFKDSLYDKVFLVTVEPDGVRYRVAGREWDEAPRRISPVVIEETLDRRSVAETAFGIIQRLFHPIIQIDRATPQSAELSLRAGAFPSVDPNADQLEAGTLILPFYRYLNEDKVVQSIQFVPWTYLRVQEFHRGYVKCAVISGLRAPLGMGRRRVELMGMVLRPQVESTRLKMVFRSNSSKPLVGYRVTVTAKTFADDEPQTEPVEMLTNRQGTLLLKHDPDNPMLWLTIHSGKALLARLPFATGVVSKQTFQLFDDSLRLSVEGEIEILKGKLIDLVARRSTHMAFAKFMAGKKEWEKVDEEIRKLEALPTTEEFQTLLTTIREPALEEANRIRRRRTAAKIRKMS
ncbi:MAG: hypothetical protein IH899_09295, partial [Planctomycetes bacterium]|nr:hypothetical protein [Planctomycetota bacterium]